MLLALFKIAKVTKHRIDRKKKKKKWSNGRNERGIRRNFVANCYFIPWAVFTSDSTRSTSTRRFTMENFAISSSPPTLHKENAVQPMNDWELERGIRFALQGIPDNFARLSDERPLFAILLLVKMFHGSDRMCCTFRVRCPKRIGTWIVIIGI